MSICKVSVEQKLARGSNRNPLSAQPGEASESLPLSAWTPDAAKHLLASVDLKRMPGMVGELAEQLGTAGALALVEHFGGTTLSVPLRANVQGEAYFRTISQRIGKKTAEKLCQFYAGTDLYIPNCGRVLLKVRNAFLLRDRDALAGDGIPERKIITTLARRYQTSDRTVWRILKQSPIF